MTISYAPFYMEYKNVQYKLAVSIISYGIDAAIASMILDPTVRGQNMTLR